MKKKEKIHKHEMLEVTTLYKQDGTQETINAVCSSCREYMPEAVAIFREREKAQERLIKGL